MTSEPETNHPNPGTQPDTSSGPTVMDLQTDAADSSTVQADLEKFRELAMRTQADFENFRKRAARERENAERHANFRLLEDLLPILDNFELGLAAARADDTASPIVHGMTMVQKQLNDFLSAHGVEAVIAERGTPFDPAVHEALGHEEDPDLAEGLVIRQLRKGYKLRERLLRAASVFVSREPSQAAPDGPI